MPLDRACACQGRPCDAETSSSAQRGDAALVVTGNPNVGKSVIFHRLTGRYATVSNYPGTTVMVTRGTASVAGRRTDVIDTPGLNGLKAASEDELVARDLLLATNATVLQVGDAKNLVRTLTLALELAEADVKTVLALNMMDEARERRIHLDAGRLSDLLGVPVIPTVATHGVGLERVRHALPQARRCTATVRYPAVIDSAVRELEACLSQRWPSGPSEMPAAAGGRPAAMRSKRAIALLWLAGDRGVSDGLAADLPAEAVEACTRIRATAQERSAAPLGTVISQARLREAIGLSRQVLTIPAATRRPWLDRLGAAAMHPVWGVPILAGVLGLMYLLVGVWAAQHGVEFLEETVFARVVTPALAWLVRALVPWTGLQALFIGEYGLLTMALPYAFAIILPIVGTFFFCFGFIEDVGYLPRLAVMANRFCRWLGLNGKAVLPLVLGLGCGTMATMTTRILDSKRDRLLATLLIALAIPCSAQLGVILAMLAGQPPVALWVWGGVLATLLVAVGRLADRLVPGAPSPFLYEIPPLRRPKLSNVLIKTLGRLEWYLKEAVPLFFLGTLVLFLLDAAGWLAVLERLGAPLVVSWLGLPVKATEALLIGFLRRDFGAAGFYALQRSGQLTTVQTIVSLVTITLFLPCIAQYFMMMKERGWKVASLMAGFVFAVALLTGGVLWRALTAFGIS